ncbi:hypothetical protein BDW22DRAFT_1006406 [Trametopsis cervina]|nr:hypothetical protein BDW22DRAFT_1006406 [Trametopsis cervina]
MRIQESPLCAAFLQARTLTCHCRSTSQRTMESSYLFRTRYPSRRRIRRLGAFIVCIATERKPFDGAAHASCEKISVSVVSPSGSGILLLIRLNTRPARMVNGWRRCHTGYLASQSSACSAIWLPRHRDRHRYQHPSRVSHVQLVNFESQAASMPICHISPLSLRRSER